MSAASGTRTGNSWVRKMLQDHPEWDPQEIEELHRHLDSFE
jgi:hypothetical protein